MKLVKICAMYVLFCAAQFAANSATPARDVLEFFVVAEQPFEQAVPVEIPRFSLNGFTQPAANLRAASRYKSQCACRAERTGQGSLKGLSRR